MESTTSSPSSEIFSQINRDSSILMDQYLNNQIKNIPNPLRYRIIGKLDYTAESFMRSYQEYILENPQKETTRYPRRYEGLTELYKALVDIGKGLTSRSVSEANFLKRCKLLNGITPMKTEEIRKYFDKMNLNFHLFGCLHEIVFNKMEWTGYKREVLNHYMGYSNRYEKLTKAELDRKLQTSKNKVCDAANLIERRVSDIIKAFKVLTPYCSYESKYLCNAEVIKIDDKMADRICKDEGIEGITPCLAAKVLSVIYNYKLGVEGTHGKKENLLIKERAMAGKSKAIEVHTTRKKMRLVKQFEVRNSIPEKISLNQ